MRFGIAVVFLSACSNNTLSVADLSSATADIALGQLDNGGVADPSATVTFVTGQSGCPELAPDVTALFAGQPAIVSAGGDQPSDVPFSDNCAPPRIVSAQPLPSGQLQLIVSDPANDASLIVENGAEPRTVTWLGDLVRGATATLQWSPAADALSDASVTCTLASNALDTVISVAATVDGPMISFVVPATAEQGELTCTVQVKVEPRISECTGFARCTVDVASGLQVVAPETSVSPS